MPAAKTVAGLNVVAVAEQYDKSKIMGFSQKYGIEGMDSFDNLIAREDIDSIYVPQPPSMHYEWAKKALQAGKHVMVEKPSTTSFVHSQDLVRIAKKRHLALHENYMFQYHSQVRSVQEMLKDGVIGEIRLYRTSFGFPFKGIDDFRYIRPLGGGSLLDAGGYTLKLATILLGNTVKVEAAKLSGKEGFDVDIYGSAYLSNDSGCVCEASFGMDCAYKCSLEVWGSKGTLFTNRIFTAPDGYKPIVAIETGDGRREIKLGPDSHFKRSIERFMNAVEDAEVRGQEYKDILTQAGLVERVGVLAGRR